MKPLVLILALVICLGSDMTGTLRAQTAGGSAESEGFQRLLIEPDTRQLDNGNEEQEKLAQLRAGFVINFASFTTWPDSAFRDEQSPLVLTLVGDRELARQVAAMTAGKQLNGRAVLVYYMMPPDSEGEAREAYYRQLRESHLLYFSDDVSGQETGRGLRRVSGRPVLTVGNRPHFAQDGGMLGLVLRDRRLTFDANVEQISRVGLQVSSKVLRLARIVRDRQTGEES